MKTTNEILTDVWDIVNADAAITALSGGVYKKTRPTDSELVDCVISLISGRNAKFITDGAIYVKLFYNDIFANNTWYEDMAQGQQLEQLLINLADTLLDTPGYSFDVQTREHYTEAIEDIHQHYAILKMNFQLLNN